MGEPIKIPFAWPMDNRNADYTKDVLRKNAVLEKAPDGVFVVKRPGTSAQVHAGWGVGQGATYFSGTMAHVSGDRFNVTSSANSGTAGAAYTLASSASWNGRYLAASCVFQGKLWIMSGLTSVANQSSDVWSSTDGVTWVANGVAPWAPRRGFGCVVLGTKMYITGGYDGTNYFNDVWSSENGTDWVQETAAAPFLPRANIMFVAGASGMYVIGGTSAAIAAHDDVWFSADGAQWIRLGGPFGWATRRSGGTCYFDNRIWIIGGVNLAGVLQNDVWSSPDGVVWIQETAAAFASARQGVGVCVYADRMWAIGGTDGGGELADVYRSQNNGLGAWTLITAAPGFTARTDPCVQVFQTPTSASQYRFPSIWVYAGGVGFSKQVWYGQLNTALATSTPLVVTTPSQPFQFVSYQQSTRLLFKNQEYLWVWDSGTITRVADRGYPKQTVPGIVVLGGFVFVMDPTGLIYNCALDNPYYWPALNVLGADFDDDRGVALVKYKNYAVALGEFSTQLFYDAGLQFGSPLQPYLNANMKTGCATAASVQEMNDTVVWVSQNQPRGYQVVMFEGSGLKVISNLYVEKLLSAGVSSLRSFQAAAGGHTFYGLALGTTAGSVSIVYDFDTGEWGPWTDPVNIPICWSAFINDLTSQNNYIQELVGGGLKRVSSTIYADDDTVPFPVYIRTGNFDSGNRRMKFWGRLDVVGSQVTGSSPTISYTDDDYQSYSTPRTVDMGQLRPALFRNGASRRRAWVYQQLDALPMRIERLEQDFEQGV